MRTVMVSGHFDPVHDVHLDYIKSARNYGGFMICVVSSDKQLMLKKGKVNIPERGRCEIVSAILRGLGIHHQVVINYLDKDTTLVAESLRWWKPDIFCRGGDKKLEDMPEAERQACEETGIRIEHAELPIERHGANMKW